jgi:hypothetical protein
MRSYNIGMNNVLSDHIEFPFLSTAYQKGRVPQHDPNGLIRQFIARDCFRCGFIGFVRWGLYHRAEYAHRRGHRVVGLKTGRWPEPSRQRGIEYIDWPILRAIALHWARLSCAAMQHSSGSMVPGAADTNLCDLNAV